MTDPHSASLGHVRAWVFDMDDTLYPREQGLMQLVQARINAFVVEAVGLEPEAAAAMQRFGLRRTMVAALLLLSAAMGGSAIDLPEERDPELIEEMSQMIRMIITGARALARHPIKA